ncbi:[Wnt protein] O-palmitoleoyl-L-serine hydrolase [Ranunculus cassubicifolius]
MVKSNGAPNNASSQTKNYEITQNERDGPAAPGKRIEEASDSFMHAPLGSGGYSSVGRAPLLQLGRCDYGLDV